MFKALLPAILFIGTSSILTLATANEEKQTAPGDSNPPTTELPNPDTIDTSAEPDEENVSVMDLPVNFSSPEDVEKTFQLIKEQAGEDHLNTLKSALSYVLVYDLSVTHDREKMYKKLNGRTPNQIISKIKR